MLEITPTLAEISFLPKIIAERKEWLTLNLGIRNAPINLSSLQTRTRQGFFHFDLILRLNNREFYFIKRILFINNLSLYRTFIKYIPSGKKEKSIVILFSKNFSL